MITRSSNIGGSKELHDNTSMIMFGFVYWPWSESPPKIPFRVFVLLTLASIGCLKNFVVASEKSLKVFGLLDSFVSESAILMNVCFLSALQLYSGKTITKVKVVSPFFNSRNHSTCTTTRWELR